MNWKRIAPWNWFKDEEEATVAVETRGRTRPDGSENLLAELGRLLEIGRQQPGAISDLLRPNVDISEGKKSYIVRADLPGIELTDLTIEVDGHTLAIRGEKRQERESDDEGYGISPRGAAYLAATKK